MKSKTIYTLFLVSFIGSVISLQLIFGLIKTVRADANFDARSNRLRNLEAATDRQIAKLGFGSNIDFSSDKAGENEQDPNGLGRPRKPEPLLVQFVSQKPLRAQTGSFVYGRTVQKLVVGPEGSPAVIELDSTEGFFAGYRIIGKARHSATPERLQIECDRMVSPTGQSLAVKATATDRSGSLGLKAEVLSQKGLLLAGAVGTGFLSGVAAASQTDSYSNSQNLGFGAVRPSAKNLILQGVAQSSLDQSRRLIEEAAAEKPVLILSPQTPVAIYFDEEVRF